MFDDALSRCSWNIQELHQIQGDSFTISLFQAQTCSHICSSLLPKFKVNFIEKETPMGGFRLHRFWRKPYVRFDPRRRWFPTPLAAFNSSGSVEKWSHKKYQKKPRRTPEMAGIVAKISMAETSNERKSAILGTPSNLMERFKRLLISAIHIHCGNPSRSGQSIYYIHVHKGFHT